jgi:hypothetical protein
VVSIAHKCRASSVPADAQKKIWLTIERLLVFPLPTPAAGAEDLSKFSVCRRLAGLNHPEMQRRIRTDNHVNYLFNTDKDGRNTSFVGSPSPLARNDGMPQLHGPDGAKRMQ